MKRSTLLQLVSSIPHWKAGFFWLTLSTTAVNLLSLAIPLFFMQVYDRVLPSGSRNTLIWLACGIIAALLMEGIISYLRERLSGIYAGRFALSAQERLLWNIGMLTPGEFKKQDYSHYDKKFRSITDIENFYKGQLFQSLLDFPFILLFLFGIYYYTGKLVLFHLILLAILIPFYLIMGRILQRWNTRCYRADNRRYIFLGEVLKKIHFVKSQAYEEMLLRKGENLQDQYSQEEVRERDMALIPQLVSQLFSLLMVYGTIIIGGILIIRGELSLGLVTASTMLARRAISPFQNLSRFFLKLSQIEDSLSRIPTDIEKPPLDSPVKNLNLQGYFEMKEVQFPLDDAEQTIVEGFTFQAQRGTITAIYSENPERTSNLLDMTLGFQKPQKGTVILDNLKVSTIAGCYISEQFALIPRRSRLFEGTILENITRFNHSLNLQGLEAASLVGLDDLMANLPRGYETQVKGRTSNLLSPAIMQRIALAQSFVSRPRILISDFSDDGMDRSSLQDFLSLLDRNRNSCTAILFTRRRETLALADLILEIREDGSWESRYE